MPVRTEGNASRHKAGGRKASLRILFTCVGRRIELLDAFRDAARSLRVTLTLFGTDRNFSAPAMHRLDEPRIIPRIGDPRHIPELLRLIEDERIDVVIPLIDSDLLALSQSADRIAALGCTPLISDERVIRICSDKLLTFETLKSAGVDTPETWTAQQALTDRQHRFPLFIKPRAGSAGKGLFRVNDAEELRFLLKRNPESVVQAFVEGEEYTLDVYTGLDGVPRCAVPRKRLEVRTGEVSKGMIVKDPAIIDVGKRVIKVLGGCRGVVTVQCMVTPQNRIRVIEVNPRFGGGAPLSIQAGADFPRWIMAEALGRRIRTDYESYQDRLTMLRYDQSVFVDVSTIDTGAAHSGDSPTSHRA